MLHVVKNYTGDVLNFQLAAELADDEGIKVETVLVDDDVAVQDSLYTAGRRGTGGTSSSRRSPARSPRPGADLDEVAAIGRRANQASRIFGIALTSVHRAGGRHADFELGPDEIEIGIGIHGEPGRAAAPDRAGLRAGRDRHPGRSSTTARSTAATRRWLSSTAWAGRR